MFTAMSAESTGGASVTFVTAWPSGSTSAGGIGVSTFSTAIVLKGQPLPVLNESGRADTHAPIDMMVITFAGRIYGTSDSDYWTRRLALAAALLPDQGENVDYLHGRLSVTAPNGTSMYADYHTVGWEPMFDTEAPKVGPYKVTLEVPYGYWRNASGDAAIKA